MTSLEDLRDLTHLEALSASSSVRVDAAIAAACAAFTEGSGDDFIAALGDLRLHSFGLGVVYAQKLALGFVDPAGGVGAPPPR